MSLAVADRLSDLDGLRPWVRSGSVARITPSDIEVRGLRLRIGDALSVHGQRGPVRAEVIALTPEGAKALPYADVDGVGKGDAVTVDRHGMTVPMSGALIGRVLDGLGRPIDGQGAILGEQVSVNSPAPLPLTRKRITEPMPTGVRVIDTFCTTARGQRIGIFGGSGVGKSTLLGMMARGTGADVAVIALIGERGREVREFLEDELGEEGMRHSVVVVATSDQPPLVRVRASLLAIRIAEWFADAGRDVLLMMDSLTRLAMAQREVGLAAGEPPTARGYTPSVFSVMARLLERAGPRDSGTVTGFYTVLVEGDDMNDPIADSARAILDGHIVLDRRLAVSGRYPAVDPLESLSRLASKIVSPERLALAAAARDVMASAEEVRTLVEVGAYVSGSNPAADRGLALMPAIDSFLTQRMDDITGYDEAWTRFETLRAALTGAAA